MPEENVLNFPSAIQKKIVAMLMFEGGELLGDLNKVRPELFDHQVLSDIVTLMMAFYQKYHRQPSLEEVVTEFEELLRRNPRKEPEEYNEAFSAVLAAADGSYDYVRDKLLEFATHQSGKRLVAEIEERLRRGKRVDWTEYGDQLKQIAAIGTNPPMTEVVGRPASEIEPEEVDYIWPNRVAKKELTLIVGDGGGGKSLLTAWLASRVTTGDPWPDQPTVGRVAGRVVMLQGEDSISTTVRPRLGLFGARLDDVFLVEGIKTHGSDEEIEFTILNHLPMLRRKIEEWGNVQLVVIDPLTAFYGGALSGRVNPNQGTHLRALLKPLARLAEEMNVAVVGVAHLNKAETTSVIYRTAGSQDLYNIARAVWFVKWDRQPDSPRFFQDMKSNRKAGRTGLAFKVDVDTGEITWVDEDVPTAEELAAPQASDATSTTRAALWLRRWMDDHTGPQEASVIYEAAQLAGISISALKRARIAVGVRTRRIGEGIGKASRWVWELVNPTPTPTRS